MLSASKAKVGHRGNTDTSTTDRFHQTIHQQTAQCWQHRRQSIQWYHSLNTHPLNYLPSLSMSRSFNVLRRCASWCSCRKICSRAVARGPRSLLPANTDDNARTVSRSLASSSCQQIQDTGTELSDMCPETQQNTHQCKDKSNHTLQSTVVIQYRLSNCQWWDYRS